MASFKIRAAEIRGMQGRRESDYREITRIRRSVAYNHLSRPAKPRLSMNINNINRLQYMEQRLRQILIICFLYDLGRF